MRRQRAQADLDADRSAADRNKLGQFATPPDLAACIARLALAYLGNHTVRFLEPSIGTGAFYSALVSNCPTVRFETATGFEIDPRFVDAARALWSESGLVVTACDFTTATPPQREGDLATLILANPPYVRHHHLERFHKAALQQQSERIVGSKVSGLAGLYVHFLLLAHDWMCDGAIGAWLVPTEWMDVNYGVALKEYLCSKVHLLRVHCFDAEDAQFADALVSSSVLFFRKGQPNADATCELTVGALQAPATTQTVPLSVLRFAPKWRPHFSPANPQRPHHRGPPAVTLGDLVFVKRGIATGGNAFFVRTHAEFLRLGIPEKFLRPVLPSSRQLKADVIGRRPDGYPDTAEPLALLDCDVSEDEVRDCHPELRAYLESEAGQQTRQRYLTSRRRPWYSQERRALAPVLTTYMGRGRPGHPPFRFLWNQSDATATNVYLLLIPRPKLALLLAEDPQAARLIVDFLRDTDPAELLGQGRVYGGGLHKLEPRELGRLDATRLAATLGNP